MAKIGFIGAGNMGSAIIKGMLAKGWQTCDIGAFDVDASKLGSLQANGVRAFDSIEHLMNGSDIIFLAVKPQIYEAVLSEVKSVIKPEKVIVSIAAGISCAYIKQKIGFDCKVVRAMPNTPAMLGLGATALSHVSPVTDEEFQIVRSIFECIGIAETLPEDKMNEIIAVNGSSPAYIYLFAQAIVEGAKSQGIDEKVAMNLFCKTLEGSAAMLRSSGLTPAELIKMVSSPGGTTLAALSALDEMSFKAAVIEAMNRCTKRAYELGR